MFRLFLVLLALSFKFLFITIASAQVEEVSTYTSAADIPMETFAQLPKLEKISLSPDGRHLAIVYPVEGEAQFVIFDLAVENAAAPVIVPTGKTDIIWIQWVNNERILISVGFYTRSRDKSSEDWYETRMMSFNRDGSDGLEVGKWEKAVTTLGVVISKKASRYYINTDDVLSLLPGDPEQILVQVKIPGIKDFGVYKINVYTDVMTQVQAPLEPITEWYADHNGLVRFGTGFEDGKMIFYARTSPEAEWKKFDKTDIFEERGFEPLYFGFEDHLLFVRASINTGRETIYSFNMETGAVEEKIFEHPKYDARGLLISASKKKILAATYTADFPSLEFFDKDYEKMRAGIAKAMQGMRLVILDSTLDDRFHIIRSYSSSNPGTLFIYDSEKNELSPIWDIMPGLDPALMSEVKRVDYLARDGLELSGYLTVPKGTDGKNLPTVMLIHGGPWVRDDMFFDPEVQFLASRGYAVFQPNFRGSSGFGDRFQNLGNGEWGKAMQTDVTDGLNWLVKEGITDIDRVCIAGASYGGYAALMGVAKDPDLYKCAFAFAPVTDITRWMDRASDRGNFKAMQRAITPGMKRKEYKDISPVKLIKQIKVPILLMHGDEDSRVSIKHSEKMAKALRKAKKKFEFITLEGAPHGIPEEKYRFIYYRELEKFLAKNLGASGKDVDQTP